MFSETNHDSAPMAARFRAVHAKLLREVRFRMGLLDAQGVFHPQLDDSDQPSLLRDIWGFTRENWGCNGDIEQHYEIGACGHLWNQQFHGPKNFLLK
eukprot:s1051_g13.t1